MPSPFHQKYSSQNHRNFNTSPVPEYSPTRSSDEIPQDHTKARRVSGSAFDNFSALKRPTDNDNITARRASINDGKPPPGMVGSWWNKLTRGT